MNRMVGIFVCTLMIAATVIPVAGVMRINNITKVEKSISREVETEQNIRISEINNPYDNPPQPAAIKTGYLSIPAAALIPGIETTQYYNWGTYLKGNGWFNAHVYLPHEATVTKVTVYWWDVSVSAFLHFILIRYPFGSETEVEMSEGTSTGSPGEGSTVDDTIDSAEIDNTKYSYFLFVDLQSYNDLKFRNAVIEYTYEIINPRDAEDNTINELNQLQQNTLTR